MGLIHSDADLTIPALIDCLNNPQNGARAEAATALAAFGGQAKAAVPILVKLLEERTDKELMRAVPAALKKIDPEAAAHAGIK